MLSLSLSLTLSLTLSVSVPVPAVLCRLCCVACQQNADTAAKKAKKGDATQGASGDEAVAARDPPQLSAPAAAALAQALSVASLPMNKLVIQIIVSFARNSGYLFVGSTSKDFKRLCGDRSPTTRLGAAVEAVNCFSWAKDSGCPWDENIFSLTAGKGALDTLQWARSEGCPWDAHTCALAAGGGHLAVLQGCRANGCPWDEGNFAAAAAGGHLDLLKWCKAKGCP